MENLPVDMALDILSRLPIKSLIQIKCVSKSWRALALDPRLPSMHQARANAKDPSLILHCDFPSSNELYSVNLEQYNNEIMRLSINGRLKSSISEYQIVGSCNGLLCIANALHSNPMFVCNPMAGDFIELPEPFNYPDQEVALGFGFHPTTKEYKLVRIAFYFEHYRTTRSRVWSWQSDVQVLTLGDDAWRSLGRPLIPWRVNPGPSQALLNGALHWLSKFHNQFPSRASPCLRILSFDLAEEKLKEIGRPSCGSLDCCSFHLVVLRGCLSAVHCSDDGGTEIWVMKEYNVKESWSRECVIRTYLPISLREKSRQHSDMLNILGRTIKVVCSLKNEEILLKYENGALVLYNPEGKDFKDVVIPGERKSFRTIVHVESLFTVKEILGCKNEPFTLS